MDLTYGVESLEHNGHSRLDSSSVHVIKHRLNVFQLLVLNLKEGTAFCGTSDGFGHSLCYARVVGLDPVFPQSKIQCRGRDRLRGACRSPLSSH